jgi:beta-galactosidase
MNPGRALLLLTMLTAFLSTPSVHAADSPRDDPPRGRQTFDFAWKFMLGDPTGAESPRFDDTNWTPVDLPHDWSIAGPFNEDAPAGGSGAYLPTGVGWYRKTFHVPDSYKTRKVAIEFDGIYQNSEVWLNGHLLGKRPFGYIGLSYDITQYLNYQENENVVAVRADNSRQRNSRWYSGSGIYRHIWLVATDPLSISHWGTSVTTPKISPESALVDVVVSVQNARATEAKFDLLVSLLDRNGVTIKFARGSQRLDAGEKADLLSQLLISNPELWSVQTPTLYTVRCQLFNGDTLIDSYDTPIGFRTAVFDVNLGFLLNGRPVKLNGVCLHEDGGAVGSAIPEGVWIRRLKLLKEMGCNAIRTSHNPPAPEFLDLCDQMGFLVMDEAFDEWRGGKVPEGYHRHFDEWSQRDLVDFITRDRNHPCVVLWSAGNEIGEQTNPGGTEVLRALVDTFHKLDPTRPVTAACDRVYAEPESANLDFLNLLDIVGYNYVDRWRERTDLYYESDRAAFPQRRFIGTESVSMGGVRGDYSSLFPGRETTRPAPILPPVVNANGPANVPPIVPFRRLPASNRRLDVERLWKFVKIHDYVSGDFMWTGIDYLGEARWPDKSASFGVLDTCGFKKDGYYFYQSQWTDAPVLHLFPHWNWKGREGRIIPVMCYTNCDTVELFLNGKSFGIKGYEFPRHGMELQYGTYPDRASVPQTTSDLHLQWDVPFEPGTLKAVGRIGDKTFTQEISTTSEPAAIKLDADRSTLLADGRDVAHITVQIVDRQGRVVPTAANSVSFTVTGEAQLIAVDNGNPVSHESFKASERAAFNGLCLAILQTKKVGGTIEVTARSKGLDDASMELHSDVTPQAAQ